MYRTSVDRTIEGHRENLAHPKGVGEREYVVPLEYVFCCSRTQSYVAGVGGEGPAGPVNCFLEGKEEKRVTTRSRVILLDHTRIVLD